MPDPLVITIDQGTDGSVALLVVGEIDMATVPDLDAHGKKMLERSEPKVAVDLSQVTFIDSTGIATLTTLHQQLEEQGRTLTIRGLSSVTRRPFEVLHLDEVLHLEFL
jgi:anti-sigma B factor antagonist